MISAIGSRLATDTVDSETDHNSIFISVDLWLFSMVTLSDVKKQFWELLNHELLE